MLGIVFTIIAIVAAIAAVVLALIFIVPEKKRASLNKFGQFLHDTLNFKFLIVEKILQALYIFTTAFAVIYGFLNLFNFDTAYDIWTDQTSIKWYGGQGLLLLLLGPIVVRLMYEMMMMFVLLVKNAISINNKLKNQNGEDDKSDPFASPDLSQLKSAPKAPAAPAEPVAPAVPAQPAAPAKTFCPNCGTPAGDGDFCVNCGTKLK